MWRGIKFTVVGGVLQWHTRQGEWIPVDSPPSGIASAAPNVAPPLALLVPPLVLTVGSLPRV